MTILVFIAIWFVLLIFRRSAKDCILLYTICAVIVIIYGGFITCKVLQLAFRLILEFISSLTERDLRSLESRSMDVAAARSAGRQDSSVAMRLRRRGRCGLHPVGRAKRPLGSSNTSDKRRAGAGRPSNPMGVREGRREPQAEGVRAWISWFTSLLVNCFRKKLANVLRNTCQQISHE